MFETLQTKHFLSSFPFLFSSLQFSPDYIIDNTFLTSNLLRTFEKEDIFPLISVYLSSSDIDLPGFNLMSNHSITDHIVSHDLYGTLDLISEDFSILKVVIYLL